jgi:hypothetical protein
VPATNDRPQRSAPPTRAEVVMSPEELRSLLSAVEVAYEAAWHLSDVGKVAFAPFEGLPRALRILRRHRDRLAS